VLLVFLLVTSVGLIGWLVNNYNIAEISLVYVDICIILILFVISIFLNKKIIEDIKSLENL